MSIITRKQHRRHGIGDPIFILFFTALFVLAIVAISTGNLSNLVEYFLGSVGPGSTPVSVKSVPSFASDQGYWAANCTQGWSPDSLCEAIAARTQSCEISAESAYCSEYKAYLKQLGN